VQEERGVFTHVYQRVRETWQCVNGQRTIVKEQLTPPKPEERKGELPFHIPFTGGKKKTDDASSVTVMPTAGAATPPPPAPAAPAPDPNSVPPPALQDVK
jgi:hypothetical protein